MKAILNIFIWGLPFLLGAGWCYGWLSEWDSLDRKANLIIDVIQLSDKVEPKSENIDSIFAFQRVRKKATFIRNTQLVKHKNSPHTYFGFNGKIFIW